MDLGAVHSEALDTSRSKSRTAWYHLGRLSTAVLLVIIVGSLLLSLLIHDVVGDQENRILHERGSELSLLLDESVQSIATLLPIAGTAESPGMTTSTFKLIADSLVAGGTSNVVVFARKGSSFRKIAEVGKGTVMATVSPSEANLLTRASSSHGLVSAVIRSGADRWLAIATLAPDGRVIVDESVLRKVKPSPVAAGSPFSDVDLALYGSAKATSSDLLAISGALPSGHVDHEFLTIGQDKWLLVVSANQPLVGSIASWSPWMLLLVGFLVAFLVTALLAGLSRRQTYALRLVDERTTELESALAEGARLQGLEKRAREEAENANRYKSEFISRMSHELRTPLNAVIGFAQLLELDDLSEEQRDSVDHIRKGGRHLLTLINEVLDIARIEAGDLTLSSESVLVSDVFGEVLGLIRPLAQQREIHLIGVQADACSEFVFADRHRLQQVLLNLLSNAVKYNRRGGSVAVSCEHSGAVRLRLMVTDTGSGISSEQLERLFTPFERLGAERGDVEGTGIGLSLSRQLAEAMGGSLDVQSVVGRGSTFWIELPLVEGPVNRYERLNNLTDNESSGDIVQGQQDSVLYIEDNLANITLVQRIIAQREGVTLIPAMQGRLGLELAKEHSPFVVLLDLHLPDINGEEVLQQLRNDPVTAKIPVVVISADATPTQVQRLLNAGALAFLTKPFDVGALLSIIDDCRASEDAAP